jgi:hypothetical protein
MHRITIVALLYAINTAYMLLQGDLKGAEYAFRSVTDSKAGCIG